MIVLSYWTGGVRVGMLAWRETPSGLVAIGGFDPSQRHATGNDAIMVVSHDDYERTIQGWHHPDAIMETQPSATPADDDSLVTIDDSRWEPVDA